VPALTAFAAAASSPGWICTPGPGAGASCTLTVGTLNGGETAHRDFAVTVAAPLPAGAAEVDNRVRFTIANEAASGRGAAGTVSCAAVTTPTAGMVRLLLVKSYGGGPAAAGATLVFGLAASNAGTEDAAGVVISETVPLHTRFAAGASSPGWSCAAGGGPGDACTLAVGTLAAGGAAVTAAFAVTVDAALPPGVAHIGNAACLLDARGDAACGQVETPAAVALAATLADAVVGRSGEGAAAFAGDEIDYTLVLSNPSGAAADGAVVTVSLDPHLALENGSVAVGGTSGAGTVTVTAGNGGSDPSPTVTVASLAPGGVVTVSFRVRVAAALPPELTAVASQAAITGGGPAGTGGNFPATVSDDPDTAAPLDPTATPIAQRVGAAAVPALGPLGMAALAGLLAAGSLVQMRRMRGRLAAARGTERGRKEAEKEAAEKEAAEKEAAEQLPAVAARTRVAGERREGGDERDGGDGRE
jgi:uncharacterized repeat protein (TIGR01451 family)